MRNRILKSSLATCAFLMIIPCTSYGKMQDPPHTKKEVRHVVVMKTDSSGATTKLDTMLSHGDVFIWNGDTIGGEDHFAWRWKEGMPDVDSIVEHLNFNFEFDEGEGGKKIIMHKHGPGMKHAFVIPHVPAPPAPPGVPHVKALRIPDHKNMIDLNSPDVLSFERKKMKDGREKITIIRELPEGDDNPHQP